jgi:hypothetical protein
VKFSEAKMTPQKPTRSQIANDRAASAAEPDRNFVGRKKEYADFNRQISACRETPVWHLYGVGGVGKSEILQSLVRSGRERGSICRP